MSNAPLLFVAVAALVGAGCSEQDASGSRAEIVVAKSPCQATPPMRMSVELLPGRLLFVCGSVLLASGHMYVVVPHVSLHGDTLVVAPVVEDRGQFKVMPGMEFAPFDFALTYGPIASGTRLRVTSKGGVRLPNGFTPLDTTVVVP